MAAEYCYDSWRYLCEKVGLVRKIVGTQKGILIREIVQEMKEVKLDLRLDQDNLGIISSMLHKVTSCRIGPSVKELSSM